MSLVTRVTDLATRISTEFKTLRLSLTGSATGSLSGLATTDKSSLVGAINEVKTAVGAGSPTTLDDLTDVQITAAATGDILRFNGTAWVDVDGTTIYQPKSTDLSTIAAQANTPFGIALLTLADQVGLTAAIALATQTAAGIVELATNAEALGGLDSVRAVTPAALKAVTDQVKADILGAGVPAALDTLDELAAALGDDANFAATVTTALGNKQPLDATLTALAGLVTSANQLFYSTGSDTFATTSFTAFARTLLDDPDAATARGTLSVYSQAEIGTPETDFVATFEAGLL